MSKKKFEEFINRQRPPLAIDWVAQKVEWLKHLGDLYRIAESSLKDFIEAGRIVREYEDIELMEENIGRYAARSMILKFGANRIDLVPIGTLLIGTKGRVDMKGPKGTVRLILADKESDGPNVPVRVIEANAPIVTEVAKPKIWEWKVVVTTTPRMIFQKLTQETFFDAIMEVSNG